MGLIYVFTDMVPLRAYKPNTVLGTGDQRRPKLGKIPALMEP